MGSEPLEQIWYLAEQQRERGGPDFVGLLKQARAKGISVSVRELREIVQRMGLADASFVCPQSVIEFITEFLKDVNVESILDPWAGLGLVLVPLAEETKARRAVGISRNPEEMEAASLVCTNSAVSWQAGDALKILDELGEDFDIIAGCPPSGGPTKEAVLELPEGPVKVRNDLGSLVLLKACTRLGEKGVGFFVVPASSFFKQVAARSVYASLPQVGVHVDAVLSLPAGVFMPQSAIEGCLLVIRRDQPTQLFVGELSEDRKHRAVLLENLKARRAGEGVALGALVDPATFRGYRSLVTHRRAEQLAKTLGLKPVELQAVATQINLTKSSEYPGFEERPNAVYLPLIGPSHAVASLSELALKPHNYAQIVLDPESTHALYVARFFSTPLGHIVREHLKTGAVIPKISKGSLMSAQLYLPELETQTRMIEADTEISNLVSELKELEGQLWSRPGDLGQIVKDIEAVNREDRLRDWLETLPFPLASILWAYYASGDDDKTRYEHLLHFFEALAEFYATVLLSGFVTVSQVSDEEREVLSGALSGESLRRSSFGTWVRITERLSEQARTMMNAEEEDQRLCEQMFRTTRRDVLDMVFSNEVIVRLRETKNLRNEWAGHGGVVGPRAARERCVILASHLSEVRAVLGRHWEAYELIKAGSGRFVSGNHCYQVERVMGTRSMPFEHVEVTTIEPMEDGALYLLTPGELKPLKLLPLIKVMPSPVSAQNACYFYNRVRPDGKIRFVSYHFEPEADIEESFEDTAGALELIHPHRRGPGEA